MGIGGGGGEGGVAKGWGVRVTERDGVTVW